MASKMLSSFQALDVALAAGWQLHVEGRPDYDLTIVTVFRPRQPLPWTTIYSTGGALDALNRAGETIREVVDG
jgi:hypothetical protein